MSKSQQIRDLAEKGTPKGQIAKIVGVRYQFVYNVLKNEEYKKGAESNEK